MNPTFLLLPSYTNLFSRNEHRLSGSLISPNLPPDGHFGQRELHEIPPSTMVPYSQMAYSATSAY